MPVWKMTVIQWPAPSEDHPGTPTLHKDGKFTCGLGVLKAIDWIPPAEVPDKEYPMVLSTGRRLYHYHTRTQTGRCEGINDLLGEETADISAADAEAKGIDRWRKNFRKIPAGRGGGEGPCDQTGSGGTGLDGLPFPRSLRQLAYQSGL